jgi:hypothetical protein
MASIAPASGRASFDPGPVALGEKRRHGIHREARACGVPHVRLLHSCTQQESVTLTRAADGKGRDRFNSAAVTICIPAPPLLTRGVIK